MGLLSLGLLSLALACSGTDADPDDDEGDGAGGSGGTGTSGSGGTGTSGSGGLAQDCGSGGSGTGGSSGGSGGSGTSGSAGSDDAASDAAVGCAATRENQLAIGQTFSCVRLATGSVHCWGANVYGQLGQVTPDRGLLPGEMGDNLSTVALGTGLVATSIATGPHHACAILGDGSVKCWGHNRYGALGLGDTDHRAGPTEMGDALPRVALGTGRTAKALSLGFDFSCALLDNGTVKCWGNDEFGQLGQGTIENIGDQPGEMGDALPAIDLGTGRTALAITAGQQHVCAILDDTTLKCWGYNTYFGVLGLGDNLIRGDEPGEMGDALPRVNLGTGRSVVSVSAGRLHTCALLDDASVKCWGNNAYGQLGLGDTASRGGAASEMGDALPSVDLGTGRIAKQIIAGPAHNCVITLDNRLVCWGSNGYGELGLGDTEQRGDEPGEMGGALPTVDLGTGRSAVKVDAGLATCALLDDQSVKCWGNNETGGLGLGDRAHRGDQPGEMGDALPTVNLGSGASVTSLGTSAPNLFHCALRADGSIKCWGANYFGELGSGSNTTNIADEPGDLAAATTLNFGTGRCVRDLSAGGYVLCAALDDGTVKCMGKGSAQLGQGDWLARGARLQDQGDNLPPIDLGSGLRALKVALGLQHACALFEGGRVKCWGSNDRGQLGIGDRLARGDDPGEMGDLLPFVDLGTGRTARALYAGGFTSCAVLDDASLKCWGANSWGMLGLGDTNDRGDAPGEMGDQLPAIDLGTGRTARRVAIGINSTCAILDDQTVKCWGGAGQALLGNGSISPNIGDNPGEMGDSLPIVSLGTGRKLASVSVGYLHACVSFTDGGVKCWGDGAYGQLGLGDTSDRGDAPGEMGDALPVVDLGTGFSVASVTVGYIHSCALSLDATVKCWGNNDSGQLGLGNDLARGDQPGEMGSALPIVAF